VSIFKSQSNQDRCQRLFPFQIIFEFPSLLLLEFSLKPSTSPLAAPPPQSPTKSTPPKTPYTLTQFHSTSPFFSLLPPNSPLISPPPSPSSPLKNFPLPHKKSPPCNHPPKSETVHIFSPIIAGSSFSIPSPSFSPSSLSPSPSPVSLHIP
jgi:hypothetical protein